MKTEEKYSADIYPWRYMSALYPSSVFSSEDDDGAICGPMLQAGISSEGVRERSVIEMRSVSYEQDNNPG